MTSTTGGAANKGKWVTTQWPAMRPASQTEERF